MKTQKAWAIVDKKTGRIKNILCSQFEIYSTKKKAEVFQKSMFGVAVEKTKVVPILLPSNLK